MNEFVLPDLEEFQEYIHKSFTSWGELGSTDEQLLSFLLLVQRRRKEYGDELSPLTRRQATNDVLQDAIEELAVQQESEAAVLRVRFIEGEITRKVANQMYASTDQVNRWQRSAIENLARILLHREENLRERRKRELEIMLPAPPYERLFGFDSLKKETFQQLTKADSPWTIAIAGIGGIGKTSLADIVTREALQQLAFERAVWVRSGPRGLDGEKLPPEQGYEQILSAMAAELWPDAPGAAAAEQRERLRRAFGKKRHLIIIDNLESDDETAYVLEQIHEFTEPSKVIVTSRARPTLSLPAFFIFVEELSLADSAEMIRQQAKSTGLVELTEAPDEDMRAIYDVAGGNPLALKLIVSLASVLPFDQILADLAKSRPGPIENLYRFIYLESWRSLGTDAQALLQAMPLVADVGALPEQMQAISGLVSESFWTAVTELVSRSLLEVRGSLHDRRYGIHRLTETFLRTEIIHWPED